MSLQQELAQRQDEIVQRAEREVDEQLQSVQQKLSQRHGDILQQLEIGDQQINALKRQITAGIGSPDRLLGRGGLLDLVR